MPQIFKPRADTIAQVFLFRPLLATAGLLWVSLVYTRSPTGTEAGVVRVQPVPFSHEHHVGVLGIDCRYCHTTVEKSSFAGFPATQVCMNCHSRFGSAARCSNLCAQLEVGRAIALGIASITSPGFVYFDHSIHVQKGVGCSSCHGRIDRMPLT